MMMRYPQKVVSAEIAIYAPAHKIFDFVAKPRNHSLMDGSGTVVESSFGPDRLYPEAMFGMRMHLVVPYRITNKVVSFEEGEEIAWRHVGRHVWRYRFEPVTDEETKVVESFEWDRAPLGPLYELTGTIGRNLLAMRRTLSRLKELMENHG
jgi:hypothetical protein